jgi:tRNA-binding EMAP/Myf-like protein
VGKITKVWKHEESENLYCEEIDIGGETRAIGSGLQKFVPLEKMENALVVVICNLKARNLAGYKSHGMVLCAETPDKSEIQLLCPPAGSVAGDKISFPGFDRTPVESLPGKNNAWDKTVDDLKIDASGVANWKGAAFTVEGKGTCQSSGIKNGIIH